MRNSTMKLPIFKWVWEIFHFRSKMEIYSFFLVKKDHYYIRRVKTKVSLALQCNNMLKEMGKVLEETGEKH